MEWQRNQNPHEERGEGRIMVPIQAVGDGERQEERIVQEYTVQITKFPREQDELQGTAMNVSYSLFLTKLESGASMQR